MIGRQTAVYPQPLPGRRPTFRAKEPEPPHIDAADEAIKAYWQEAGRLAAQRTFNKQSEIAMLPQSISISIVKGTDTNRGYQRAEPEDPFSRLFGLKLNVCDKCNYVKTLCIYFADNSVEGWKEVVQQCQPTPFDFSKVAQTKEQYFAWVRPLLPAFLHEMVTIWTDNRPIAIATEVKQHVEDNSWITITLKEDDGQKYHIPLKYSKAKCIELNPVRTTAWAARAIKDGNTVLNRVELSEFLQKTIDTTFAFFKMKAGKGKEQTFLMALGRRQYGVDMRIDSPAATGAMGATVTDEASQPEPSVDITKHVIT